MTLRSRKGKYNSSTEMKDDRRSDPRNHRKGKYIATRNRKQKTTTEATQPCSRNKGKSNSQHSNLTEGRKKRGERTVTAPLLLQHRTTCVRQESAPVS